MHNKSETRRAGKAATPKLFKKEGQERASSDFYDFFCWATAQFTGKIVPYLRSLVIQKKSKVHIWSGTIFGT